MIRRRSLLAGAAAATVAACDRAPEVTGGFSGASADRGHLLRTQREWPAPAVSRRVDVLIAG
ncbi:MAG: hypothetical protein JWP22_2791, partial [Ramlibacter sp.]|nr:hypothetical protein [Ramlibacter sp.]